jgi:FKBP-type peptidyl-prolyl cis-trans isomerase
MQKRRIHILFNSCLLVIILLVSSCKQHPQLPSNRPQPDEEQENLIALNQAIVSDESDKIERYIAQNHLPLKKDSLGFWCSPDLIGSVSTPKAEQSVTYQYRISLLDGHPCYSNLNSSRKTTIRLGKGESFSGLDLAIRKMKVGEQADFIFPSILAFGVSGDGHRIPPYSPLVCTIKLMDCK